MKLFFSVGEPSGDLHGANLIAQLRQRDPSFTALGLGGPRMAAAGCLLQKDMTELAVMGLWPVLKKLPEFFRLIAQVEQTLKAERPEGVVLIDYPGFNWHVAKKAKKLGIPVIYYGLPQIWAWAQWRVKKVKNLVDHALCKLPFEPEWFNDRGCNATYVGHPYFDELRQRTLDETFLAKVKAPQQRLVTILPGSRTQEVKNNLPDLLKSAYLIHQQVPQLRFAVASYNEKQGDLARQILASQVAKLASNEREKFAVEVHVQKTPELIAAAEVCLACSGSVSLELLYHAKPSVMLYRVPWLTAFVVHRLIQVKYMTLVNLLNADELHPRDLRTYRRDLPGNEQVLFPEYPTSRDETANVASHAIEWLTDETARQNLIARLTTLREQVASTGASETAAAYICEHIPSS